MSPSWPVRYDAVDLEIIPANVFGPGQPAEAVRLVMGDYKPGVIIVGTFVLYWFILMPFVFPATRPTSDAGKAFLGWLRDIHNVVICLYSGAVCFSTAYFLYSDGQFTDYHAFMCTPVEGTWLRVVSATFTVSKIWEWADSAFIVWLGNRPPIFLHKYHHATTFGLFCFVMNQPGPEKCGLLLNGFVHFLMYSHYFRAWPKALIPLITILQMIQLAVSTAAYTVNHIECPDAPFSADPRALTPEFITSYATAPVFLYFFGKFFVNRWIFPKKREAKKE